MSKNKLNRFPKKFKTRKKTTFIRGKLFKEITLLTPIFSDGKPISMFENSPKYELNTPRFNKLVALLKKRNSLIKEWESAPRPLEKIRLNESDLKKPDTEYIILAFPKKRR